MPHKLLPSLPNVIILSQILRKWKNNNKRKQNTCLCASVFKTFYVQVLDRLQNNSHRTAFDVGHLQTMGVKLRSKKQVLLILDDTLFSKKKTRNLGNVAHAFVPHQEHTILLVFWLRVLAI